MTVNYTTNLSLGLPVTGTESGTWGDDVNNATTAYLDIAIAGGLAITITTANVTLTNTQGTSSATNIGSTTAQYAILNISGAMTAARSLILPSSSRQYVINNNTTGGFALTVKGSATSGVTMVNGEKAHVFWNGSDYAKLSNAQGGAGAFTTLSASTQVVGGATAIYSDGTIGTPTLQINANTGVRSGAVSIADTTSAIAHLVLRNPNGNVASIGTNGTSLVFDLPTGTERARIDSSGNLLVGTTNSSVTAGAGIKMGSDGTDGSLAIVGGTSTNSTVTYRLYSTGAAAYRFYVGYGGTVYATSATITSISDKRLKENIRDLDDGLTSVMALKPRKFDWKEGKGADIKNARGFIAQEFEQVFPEMIDTWQDPAPEGEEPYKAVRADLIPTLVKAIQEQQALITSLTDRIAALEAR